MAFKFGNDATFQLDNTAGTLTDLSAYVSSVTMTGERDTSDLPRLGGNQTAQLVGPVATTIELEGWYDPTLDEILESAMWAATAATRSAEFGPQGSAGGSRRYTAEVYVAEYEVETAADDPGSWSATMVVDENGLTQGTF